MMMIKVIMVTLFYLMMVGVKEITAYGFMPTNRFNYNDDYPSHRFSYENLNDRGPHYKEIDDYFNNDCKCILLKECKSMIFLLTQFKLPLPSWFVEKLRSTSCGYFNGQPKVCCPYDKYGMLKKQLDDDEEEDPWIWGESSSEENVNSRFGSNFNKDLDKFQNKLIDFEDKKTHKNCPPSYYNDEDSFDYNFDYHSFDHKRKFKNKHRTVLKTNKDYIVTPSDKESKPKPKKVEFTNVDYCGVSVRTRLIGGNDVAPGQLPWMARVGYINTTSNRVSYRCAGSVISQQYVITAAHCVTNLVDDLKVYLVRLGDLRSSRKMNCNDDPVRCRLQQDFDIDSIISHPNYDQPKYANDIALIKYKNTNPAQRNIPICLPLENTAKTNASFGILAGWNNMSQGKSNLKYIQLPMVNNSMCSRIYAEFSVNSQFPITITSSQLCFQGGRDMDACQGDSGGPLMSEGPDSKFTLVGLVSFGPRTCGISNFPGVYTKVDSFIPWIMQYL